MLHAALSAQCEHCVWSGSEALLGGMANYYLQAAYITWKQAEEIEARWRADFKRRFGRGGGIDASMPRAMFYRAWGGWRGRTHIWAVGLATLKTSIDRAMSIPSSGSGGGDPPRRGRP